jgi:hypothetical protein
MFTMKRMRRAWFLQDEEDEEGLWKRMRMIQVHDKQDEEGLWERFFFD